MSKVPRGLFDDEPALSDKVKAAEVAYPASPVIQKLASRIREGINTRQIILGKVPPKSNCYRIIIFKNKTTGKNHYSLAKTKQLRTYEKEFGIQCAKYRGMMIGGSFSIDVDVFFDKQRSDLDNALKAIMDCLQQCGAIANDNLCVEIVARKHVDKNNPRIEFELKEKAIEPHER
jgi:Holliday junction resolvase RusA-like endonuclease